MEFFLVSLLNGVTFGLILFMVASGLTLVFGMMGVLNFAHASFYMVGAYIGFTLTQIGSFWLGIILAPILVGGIGIAIERYMLRSVHKHGHAHELLLTFGLAFAFEEIIKIFYGDYPVNYRVPPELQFAALQIGNASYPFYRLFMGLVAVLMFVFLYYILKRTRVGITVRAAVYIPDMVGALGHNVPRLFMSVFGIGAALAGLAGAVAGAFYTTSPEMAISMAVLVFVVVVVGGLGSVPGALVASLLIGVLTSFAIGFDHSLANLFALVGLGPWAQSVGGLLTMPVSALAGAIPFILMLIILVARPSGLMGESK